MGFPIKMRLKNGEKVDVYNFYNDGSVLVWSDNLAYRQNGCGWRDVKRKDLRPLGFSMENYGPEVNAKVNLVRATFQCSDGTKFMSLGEGVQFVRDAKDVAIAHERNLKEANDRKE